MQNQVEAHGELVGDIEVGVSPELEEPLLVQRRGHDVRKLEDAVAAAGEGCADVDAGKGDAAARDEPVETLVGVAVSHRDSLHLCTCLCT